MADESPAPRFDTGRVLAWCVVVAVVGAAVAFAFVLPRRELPPAAVPGGPSGAAAGAGQDDEDETAPPPPPATGLFERPVGELADVPAVERSGLPLRTADLLGRWLVVDFVFANCAGTCPQLQSRLAKLQDATRGDTALRLVSVTVDPAHDSPEDLAAWADALGADRSRWLFLRMETPELRRFMKDGFLVPTPDDTLFHSNLFLLVGPEGRVRGRYAPLEHGNWLEVLLADLRKVRSEEAAGDR